MSKITPVRPGLDTRLMAHAYIEQDQSTCDRNHVGCVISRDRRIIATGYNGAPAGMPHCDHKLDTFNAVELDPYQWPRADRGCRVSVHAEANAFAFAAKHGLATDGGTLHVTLSPCYECSKLIINGGIVRVVFDRPYRDLTGVELLRAAGIGVERIGVR